MRTYDFTMHTGDRQLVRETFKNDAAVLFVHGIGWQKPGETLQSFVTPIQKLLQQLADCPDLTSQEVNINWVTLQKNEKLSPSRRELFTAWLRQEFRFWCRPPRGEPPSEPQYTECEIVQSMEHSPEHHQRWLLVESCWARSFPSPTGRELAGWAIKTLPWFALFYTGATFVPNFLRWRAGLSNANALTRLDFIKLLPKVLLFYLRLIANALLVLFTSVVAIPLIMLGSCVPVLRWMGLAAVGLIGDSYEAIARPGSLDEMIDQIQKDIRWCLKRSPHLVIVAHSQGAMLTREALSRMKVGNRVVLIGLGSGIALLQTLQQTELKRIAMYGWLGLMSACASVIVCLELSVTMLLELFQDSLALFSALRQNLVSGVSAILNVKSSSNFIAEMARLNLEIINIVQSSRLFDVEHLFITDMPRYIILAIPLLIQFYFVQQLGFQSIPDRLLDSLTHKPKQVRRWIEFASWHDPVTVGSLLKASRVYSRKSRKELTVEVRMISNGSILPFEHVAYRHNPLVLLRIIREINQSSKRPLTALTGFKANEIRRAALCAQRSSRLKLSLQRGALELAIALLIGGAIWVAWS